MEPLQKAYEIYIGYRNALSFEKSDPDLSKISKDYSIKTCKERIEKGEDEIFYNTVIEILNSNERLLYYGIEDLSLEEAYYKRSMNWVNIIQFFSPMTTKEAAIEIYDKCVEMAYEDAIHGRRPEVTNDMVFDTIKYIYFKNKPYENNLIENQTR